MKPSAGKRAVKATVRENPETKQKYNEYADVQNSQYDRPTNMFPILMPHPPVRVIRKFGLTVEEKEHDEEGGPDSLARREFEKLEKEVDKLTKKQEKKAEEPKKGKESGKKEVQQQKKK